MGMVALGHRIASSYVVFFGVYGEVTRQAQQRGVSRQTIYREAAATRACLEDSQTKQQNDALHLQVQQLQQCVAKLQEQLARAVVLTPEVQACFAAEAEANGVSLPIASLLLHRLQPEQALSVAQLGRLVQEVGKKAGSLLAVFDEFTRAVVRQAAPDEIYVPAPVLMMVEPESLCWTTGQITSQVSGESWATQLGVFPHLEQTVRDGGMALHKGVGIVNAQRHAQGLPPVADQLDHFHTIREGNRAQAKGEHRWQRLFRQAEESQRDVEGRRRAGQAVPGGLAVKTNALWRRAEGDLDQLQASAVAWKKTQAALRLFTPEGELNTRAKAQAVLAQTVPQLSGADFAKTRRFLQDPRTLTYLDEVERKLQALVLPPEIKQAAIRVEGLRRHPEVLAGEGQQAAALRGVLLVCSLLLSKAGQAGINAQQAVRKIFRTTWRASSMVEGINSVLRMHQRRHRKITQGLLDLKRLYWNCHAFRTGHRKRHSPYQLLGLKLPEGLDWWDVIKLTPEQLRETLSELNKTE
jgi:hypothetical protein